MLIVGCPIRDVRVEKFMCQMYVIDGGLLLLVLCDNEHILTCKLTYVNCYYYFTTSNCHEQRMGIRYFLSQLRGCCLIIISTNLQPFEHSLVLQSQVCNVYGNFKHCRQQYIQFILFEMQLMISNTLVHVVQLVQNVHKQLTISNILGYHTYSPTCLKFMVVLL